MDGKSKSLHDPQSLALPPKGQDVDGRTEPG